MYKSFKKEVTGQLALGKFVTSFEVWPFLGTMAVKPYFKYLTEQVPATHNC